MASATLIGAPPATMAAYCSLGVLAPVPGVVEGFDLGVRLLALVRLEQDVVGAVGVEGGVQVNQVD